MEIKKLLSTGELDKAIERLLELAEETGNKDLLTNVHYLSASYQNLRNKELKGTISSDEGSIAQNRIVESILIILFDLEKGGTEMHKQQALPRKSRFLFALMILVCGGFFAIYILWRLSPGVPSTFYISVQVEDKEGGIDPEMFKEANALLDFPGDRISAPIDENGVARFNEIPGKWEGETVRILVSSPYSLRLSRPDSSYVMAPGATYRLGVVSPLEEPKIKDIKIQPPAEKLRRIRISGQVFDFKNEMPIPGALVLVGDQRIYTGRNGTFKTEIEIRNYSEKIPVIVEKEGYLTEKEFLYPKGGEVIIALKKK